MQHYTLEPSFAFVPERVFASAPLRDVDLKKSSAAHCFFYAAERKSSTFDYSQLGVGGTAENHGQTLAENTLHPQHWGEFSDSPATLVQTFPSE